ncbi:MULTISPECIES: hypothetical protein [Empedobacter]|uniref:LysM domain-containing protein n=1 Tax=Empedobacter falsenii TaxID=343874 RepID=A0A7H9DQ04_9FLAO|nr:MULTISPECIES: hypothetical protein [Empedobacter]MDH2208698.1 hypothetical protein [Empedobacter sp. GD03644]QLL57248.1 hypothetical protein FH779_03720 [Empedobacter falsenii]
MSTTEFYIHKIQKNDTLLSVAKRLQIHPVDLKFFHNERCEISERIVFDHLRGINFLFVPISINSNSSRNREKANERPNQFFGQSFYKNEYQITEIINDNHQKQNLISYNITLNFKEIEHKNIVEFNRKEFRRNGEIPDEKLYHLAQKTQQSIFPFRFVINEKGKFISVFEPEKLIKNFHKNRKEIEADFIGDLTEKYLDAFEYNLTNKDYLLNQFTSSLLFQVLFMNREVFQTENNFLKKFYLVPNSFAVNCECNVSYYHFENDVSTIINAKTINNYDLENILNGIKSDEEDKTSSFYTELFFEYKTDKKVKQLLEANAEIQLYDNEKLYRIYKLILK